MMTVLGLFFVLMSGIGDSLEVRAAWVSSFVRRAAGDGSRALHFPPIPHRPREIEKESEDIEWVPEGSLKLERDGSRTWAARGSSGRFPTELGDFDEGGSGSSRVSEPGSLRPLSTLSRDSAVNRRSLDPLSSPCNFQNLRASREKGMARGSVGPSLPDWIDNSGIRFGSHSILSVKFDMLGFEETDPDRGLVPDDLHASPRLNSLAPSLGINLKF
jgi:hypothetical protein